MDQHDEPLKKILNQSVLDKINRKLKASAREETNQSTSGGVQSSQPTSITTNPVSIQLNSSSSTLSLTDHPEIQTQLRQIEAKWQIRWQNRQAEWEILHHEMSSKIAHLKKRNAQLASNLSTYKRRSANRKPTIKWEHVKDFLNAEIPKSETAEVIYEMAVNASRPRTIRRFSEPFYKFASGLRFRSFSAYQYLYRTIPLPHKARLRAHPDYAVWREEYKKSIRRSFPNKKPFETHLEMEGEEIETVTLQQSEPLVISFDQLEDRSNSCTTHSSSDQPPEEYNTVIIYSNS